MGNGFLIELPSHKVKELAGKRMMAITDMEMCVCGVEEIRDALDMIENMTDTLIENYAMESVSPDLLATLTYLEWGVRSLALVCKRDLSEMRDDDPKLVDALVEVIEDLHGGLHELID